MQAGFALVEAGFTRSKNTTNILFKNLMDFSIGTIVFWALITSFILFRLLKLINGLRVDKRIEEEGLDVYEHGESAYNM